MTWRLLSENAGKQTFAKKDGDDWLIHSRQECTPILEVNKRLRDDDPNNGWDSRREYQHIANIPNTVIHQWMQEGINVWNGEHQDRVAKKLNDPDNFFLRTGGGRLGAVGDGTYR